MKTSSYLLGAIVSLMAISCLASKGHSVVLSQVEMTINDAPDSALVELQGIDPLSLTTREDEATYALLYSIALDKNYIDIQSDSIIAPAVEYFLRKGDADQKIRTCYYRARIAENAGNDDEAMQWLVKGEHYIKNATDNVILGKLYSKKSSLYYKMYDFSLALSNDSKAAEYYLKAGHIDGYVYSLIDLANDYMELEDYEAARNSLNMVKPYWDSIGDALRSSYFSSRIHLSLGTRELEEASLIKDSCLNLIYDNSLIPWLDLTDVYLELQQPYEALGAIVQFSTYNSDFDSNQAYLLRLSKAYEEAGNYQQALDYYKNFVSLSGLYDMNILNSDTRFVEERYVSEIQDLRNKNRLFALLLMLFAIGAGSVLIVVSINKARKMLSSRLSKTERMYKELQAERDSLLAIRDNNTTMDEESKKVISKRLEVLNKVLIGHMSSDPVLAKEANSSISNLLDDKKEFIESTTRVFYTSHPKMIQFLRDSSLTEVEIGYCCLFLMGMHAKDMDPYFSRNACNTMNNVIRKKLSIPQNGQKLKTFLSEKLTELEEA